MRRKRVVAVWLLLLVVLGGAAATLMGPTSDKFTMPGTESQRALDSLQEQFPQASGTTGTIVIAAPEGAKLDKAAVAPVVRDAAAVDGVVGAVDPFKPAPSPRTADTPWSRCSSRPSPTR